LPEVIDSGARLPFHRLMADAPRLTGAKEIEHAARDERLARALRENLRRRKEQARAREPNAADLSDKAAPRGKPPA
jgi:hypothetical protein